MHANEIFAQKCLLKLRENVKQLIDIHLFRLKYLHVQLFVLVFQTSALARQACFVAMTNRQKKNQIQTKFK